MRILSLTQPWASLWALGAKLIETRAFGTDYRGEIAAHAAKGFPESARHLCFTEPFKSELERFGILGPGHLPFGKILAVVDLTDVLEMVDEPVTGAPAIARFISLTVPDPRLTPTELAFGDYRPGRRAWVTNSKRRVLEEPIPYRGAQGLRDLPADVAARLAA